MTNNIIGPRDFTRLVTSQIQSAQLNAANTPSRDTWVTNGNGAYDPHRVDRVEVQSPTTRELKAGARVSVMDGRGGRPEGRVVRTLEWLGAEPRAYLVRLKDGSEAKFYAGAVFPVRPAVSAEAQGKRRAAAAAAAPGGEAQLRYQVENALHTSSSGERLGRVSKREMEQFIALAGNFRELSDGALGFVAEQVEAAWQDSPQMTAAAKRSALEIYPLVMSELERR